MKSLVRLDPFRAMRKWDPFEELRTMQHDMDKVFGRVLGFVAPGERAGLWTPSVESYTRDGKLVLKAELPGIDPKDLDVTITDRELVIKGERKEEKDETVESYAYREISYGSFERRFVLPEGVKSGEMKAKFANGILEITMPAPALPKARKIEIETPKEEKLTVDSEIKKAA
jgi:HSP20 family protein